MADDLIKRLEEATEGSRELDAYIFCAVHWPEHKPQKNFLYTNQDQWGVFVTNQPHPGMTFHDAPHYTTSLDAAMTLVPEGWITHLDIYPGDCEAHITANDGRFLIKADTEAYGRGRTAPLAIVDAALKAKDQS